MSTYLPVLIIGAGPTGLLLACELARYHVPFRIIDKKTQVAHSANATLIQTRTLEIFDQINLAKPFLQIGYPVTAINIYTKGKLTVTVPLNHIYSIFPFVLMLPQYETERLLTERLNQLHQKVEKGVELIQVEQHNQRVTATLKHADGKIEKVTSDWLVGCDGANSTVRNQCGMAFPGEDIAEQFMVADVVMASSLPKNEIHIFIDKGREFADKATLFACFPWGEKNYRIGGNLYQDAERQFFTEKEVKALVNERAHGEYVAEQVSWISPFWIHSKIVANMRHGSIFLAGDAAHIHSPIGGQGMNSGLQDAFNLAWKLAYVINNKAPASLLDSYQAERHPVMNEIVNQTEYFTKTALFNKSFFSQLKKFGQKASRSKDRVLQKMGTQIAQVNIRYQSSPVIDYHDRISGNAPKQGEHAPNVKLDSGCFYDYLHGTEYNALLFTGEKSGKVKLIKLKKIQHWLEKNYAGKIKVHVIALEKTNQHPHTILDVAGKIHARYQVKAPIFYLLRPDNYIAYCSKKLEFDPLQKFVETLFAK